MFNKLKSIVYDCIPDKLFLELKYKHIFHKKLNLKNPQTFNEKIQWLKLYDRKPEYTKMVDKYEAKKYVASIIGEEYIIPSYGVWEKFDDIDFDSLPDQFVLKTTHDSGTIVICKDKRNFDYLAAKKKLTARLHYNYYKMHREWPYKNVKPRIIAEKYMEDGTKIVPEDYKIYCINGKPKYIVVFHNRFNKNEKLSETVYDTNWNKQKISLDDHFAISNIVEPKPTCLEKLLNFAELLSALTIQSRIDFYIINGNIYFGEITLFTASGFRKMIPEDVDKVLGLELKLPKNKIR